MGVYALARRACAIASKTADGDGWRVELQAKHFRGDEPAVIEPCEMPKPGTAVTLTLQREESGTMVREQVEEAGRYHPVAIRFNGNPIEREDFLAMAIRTLEWEGLRIGVFNESTVARTGLNFHGVRIHLGDWPQVTTSKGSWSACADVIDAPRLELTLPARHDVVRNDFAKEMYRRMHRAIFQTLAAMRRPPHLAHATWREAQGLGVNYPEPPAVVTQWVAEQADRMPQRRLPTPPSYAADRGKHLVMTNVWEMSITGVLERAAKARGVIERLVAGNCHNQGYEWYDELRHVATVRIEARLGDESWSWKAQVQDARETSVPAGPVDDIDLILFDTSQTEVLRLPLEFCFLNRADELGHIDELEVLLRKGARPGTEAVYDEIMRAYFAPSDEVDADSYTTQRDHWRERAWAKAIEVTEGDAAAHATELEHAASALRLRQRAGETIVARISDKGVEIEVLKDADPRETTTGHNGDANRDDDPAYRALLAEERVLLDVSETLAEALKANGTTASRLTVTSGTSAKAVEDALGAGGGVTLRELTKIGHAVGLVPTLREAAEPADTSDA